MDELKAAEPPGSDHEHDAFVWFRVWEPSPASA